MTKRFTEKQLLEGLNPRTAHADLLAKPGSGELAPLERLRGSVRYFSDATEPVEDGGCWDEPSLWDHLGPEFQQMSPVEALSISGRDRYVIGQLMELGLTAQNLADALDAPISTITEPEHHTPLAHGMRERLARVLLILSWAESLFEGELGAAVSWMTSPAKALGGEPPLRMVGSERATEAVSDIIGRIQHGIPQ